jgi:hypothetical protein
MNVGSVVVGCAHDPSDAAVSLVLDSLPKAVLEAGNRLPMPDVR